MRIINEQLAKGFDSCHVFYCPGCEILHTFHVDKPGSYKGKPVQWKFNGNWGLPTFTPSLVSSPDDPESRCHLILTKGKIYFCGDSFHKLKNQTVPLPNLPDWLVKRNQK